MGKVHDDKGRALLREHLHAPDEGTEVRKRLKNFSCVHAVRDEHSGGGERVVNVEAPDEGQGYPPLGFSVPYGEGKPVPLDAAFAEGKEGLTAALRLAEGEYLPALFYKALRELPPDRVILIDDRRVRVVTADKAPFYRSVGLHGLMEVQMIAREVGEGGAAEGDALDAPSGDALGGDLHQAAGGAQVKLAPELALKLDGARSGVRRVMKLTREAVPDRADDAAAPEGGKALHSSSLIY